MSTGNTGQVKSYDIGHIKPISHIKRKSCSVNHIHVLEVNTYFIKH